MGLTGLLGGAFDPPHNGHVVLAEEAIRRLELERLVVVVTGAPAHKAVETDADVRFRLAAAAFAPITAVELSRYELERPGPSYTVDTVRWAAEVWGDIVFVIGADEFAGFLSWHAPEEVLRSARLAVATRPGYDRACLNGVLEGLSHPERVELFEIDALPISSTDIRERVARGETIDEFVPARVADVVAELGLYRDRA